MLHAEMPGLNLVPQTSPDVAAYNIYTEQPESLTTGYKQICIVHKRPILWHVAGPRMERS